MSARNGDKARFGKQRKRKMAHRARTQELRDGLRAPVTGLHADHAPVAEHAEAVESGHKLTPLGSAAGAIGSAIGSLAARVRGVKTPEDEPAHAE